MPTEAQPIRIALLASSTARPIADELARACRAVGWEPTITLGAYNQYAQELLDPTSATYTSNPDCIILAVDTQALLGEAYLAPYRMTDEVRRAWVDARVAEFLALTNAAKRSSSAYLIVHNLEVPLHSPLGILEHKQAFGFKESIEAFNAKLREAYKRDLHVFLFDYDAFCARVGKRDLRDHKMYYLGDLKLHAQHIPALVEAYLSYLKPMRAQTKKCLVLDCDNTLWGGVVGEDGLGGIRIGPTPEGRPFWELQQVILALFERGVVLAMNSRNNPDDVLQVLRSHPHQVLREEHFAAMRINWDDKAANLRAIAEELNIGIDSMVFIDDDPYNRAMVREALPEVTVVELPADPARYVETITALDAFHTIHLTDEDREKGKMYVQEKQRRDAQAIATDLTSYLRQLALVVTIERAHAMMIPRIAQLTQKTNQFTMTTRRYSEADIERFVRDQRYLVVSLRAGDRFGDSGIVGAAIVERGAPAWRIDTFLLSCRVIGRRIEDAFLAYLMRTAKQSGAQLMRGEFISTKKNAPAREFYRTRGFTDAGLDGSVEWWERDCSGDFPFPELLTVHVEEREAVPAL